MLPKEYTSNLSDVIQMENIDDLRLTIYYIHPLTLTEKLVNIDRLISWSIVNKIVVDGSELKNHIDLLEELSNTKVIPVTNKTYLNARLYYIVENKKNYKKFEVTIWSASNNSLFVNGVEVERNDVFYYAIIPFLPEKDEAAQAFREYFKEYLKLDI